MPIIATQKSDAGELCELTESAIRSFIKDRIPKFLHSVTEQRIVEEMEVSGGLARVDIAVIGDQLLGIEIKGPRDSVARLPRQALAYSACLDRVVLVVHASLARKASAIIPDWWGLIVGEAVSGRIRYQVQRWPEENPNRNLDSVLSLLWKEELVDMSATLLDRRPKVSATKRTIREALLATVDSEVLYVTVLSKLRAREGWRTTAVR